MPRRGEHPARGQSDPEPIQGATSDLPLPALLSQALVAFTVELDNEFEHQMPHRTTNYGSPRGAPWLVSLVMWSNCMQFVNTEGVTVSELQRLARTETNLAGMRRWGYITIEPDITDSRSKQPRPEAIIRTTSAGQKAQEIWRPLFSVIEKRWQERFGKDEIDQLRKALAALASQFNNNLPECLPILGYGLFSRQQFPDMLSPIAQRVPSGSMEKSAHLPLSALLSQVLLALAVNFERGSELPLAICANILRVLDEQGIQARDLPHHSGVSKEAISMAMGTLDKRQLVVTGPDPAGGRFKVLRLTSRGREAQEEYLRRLSAIEKRWQERIDKNNSNNLRKSLEHLVGGKPAASQSPLFKGLEPYPDGWRAQLRRPDTLPHYPMILHRGGFPDGS